MLMMCLKWWSLEIGSFLAGSSWNRCGCKCQNRKCFRSWKCRASQKFLQSCSFVHREIVTLVSRLMLIFAPFHLCDGIAGTCIGILRGIGKQKIGAVANAVGFYLVGLPVGISLMFAAKLGVIGLWIGMIFPVFMQSSFFMVYILHMNWDKACLEAQIRAGVKTEAEDLEPKLSYLDSPSTENGDGLSYQNGHSDFSGAVIVPDVSASDSHSEHLVLKKESSVEAVVGEVLSTKQLIIRRGLALLFAVIVLLIGILVRHLTGNGWTG